MQVRMMSPSPIRFAQQTAAPPQNFDGESYDGKPLGTFITNARQVSTPVSNRMKDGVAYPLLVGLRPAQMQVLADISTKLDTLNTTIQQGFQQFGQVFNSRFNGL